MSQFCIFLLRGRGEPAVFATQKHAQRWQILPRWATVLTSINLKSKVVAIFFWLYNQIQAVAPTGQRALLPSRGLRGRMAVLISSSCVFHQLDFVD